MHGTEVGYGATGHMVLRSGTELGVVLQGMCGTEVGCAFVLIEYDHDKRIAAFGFGAMLPGQ
eukprot:2367088-Rhodomonas_salina.1